MEYLIVSGETLEDLVAIVNLKLAEGWRPLGGPFVVSRKLWGARPEGTQDGDLVAQALVREENGR